MKKQDGNNANRQEDEPVFKDSDIDFDGKDNVYSVVGDVGKANSMHVFSFIALLHESAGEGFPYPILG